ncbi:MAG: helix-turn-helix transcriptional regulator [Pyrinomonadaceae bacterium]
MYTARHEMSTSITDTKGLVLSRTKYVTSQDVNYQKEVWRQFGRLYKIKREQAGLTQEDVAKKTLMNVKSISRIENGTPTKRETVQLLAMAIDWDMQDALEASGYLERIEGSRKPQNAAEFVKVLSDMGFDIQISADYEKLGPEQLQELIDDIQAKLMFRASRKQ